MGEFELIERVRRRLAEAGVATGEGVLLGSGDDAALIASDGTRAVSVDVAVDGVHFRRERSSLAAIGRKALASALSDLAAIGAGPGEALVALGVPADLDEDGCAELTEGLVAGAADWGVALIGGDVSSSPVFFVSVTVLGPVGSGGAVRRDGAREGDLIVVTGELGGAAAGLIVIDRPELVEQLPAGTAERLRRRQLEPEPRLAAGVALAEAGASAMIDLSDGLAGDAGHVAAASGVRLAVELERLPIAAGVAEVAAAAGRDLAELTVAGGEDYELLAAAPEDALRNLVALDIPVSVIGEVVDGRPGVDLIDAQGERLITSGFDQLMSG
ncbi:MAG: thiamine-phosphate kinase [Solirubrobacterales bacterium]